MDVPVVAEERYWYPEDGGVVWLAGYTVVDAATGDYLARDAPELAAAGLRVAGVAGAARHHGEALASDAAAPGAPLSLRRDPGNEHDPNAIAVDTCRRAAARLGPARARRRAGAADRRRGAVVGRRAARAARRRRATRARA